uniref:Hsp20/alpha crystallin family protein n=1 Tax=Trichloromonas sp. TaxID=3069249 RepID=UPI003D81A876
MDSFSREMDQMFRNIGFARLLEPALAPLVGAGSYPRINLRETESSYIIETQLPGIDPRELEMSIIKGTLTLSGERKKPAQEIGSWHRRERSSGKFMRAIDIPAEIEIDKVTADYRDGLLTITLPKAASVRPKRIEITAN